MMKRRSLELIAILVVVAGYFASRSSQSIVGQWETEIASQRLLYTFRESGTVDFEYTSPPLPKCSGTYTVKASQHPALLEIHLQNKVIECIWEITSEGQLRIEEIDSESAGPRDFGPKATLARRPRASTLRN